MSSFLSCYGSLFGMSIVRQVNAGCFPLMKQLQMITEITVNQPTYKYSYDRGNTITLCNNSRSGAGEGLP